MKDPKNDSSPAFYIFCGVIALIIFLFIIGLLFEICFAIYNFANEIIEMYNFYKQNKGAYQREAALKKEMEETMTAKLAYFKYEVKKLLKEEMEETMTAKLAYFKCEVKKLVKDEIKTCQAEFTRQLNQLESKIENSSAQKLAKSTSDFISLESANALPGNIKFEGLDFYKYHMERVKNESLIVAVDATRSRGGGLLYDPEKKTITTYSVDWTPVFNFNAEDSDKFEMVNALLALELMSFDILTGMWGTAVKSLVFKTDNTFILDGYKKLKNAKFRNLYDEFTKELSSRNSDIIMQHSNSKFDCFIQSADKLSRNKPSPLANLLKELGSNVENQFCWTDSYVRKSLIRVIIRLQNIAQQSGETYSFLKV